MTEPTTPEWAAGWSPSVESRTAEIAAHPAAGLAAWLDADPSVAAPGRPLPPLWHWAVLSQWSPAASLGPDGHPRTGGFLPRTPYPRRMWVGCTVDLHAPALIGTSVTVERTVTSLTEKTGRHGRFALVTVRTSVSDGDGTPLLTEQTRLAYRGQPDEAPPREPDQPVTVTPDAGGGLARVAAWSWTLTPTAPLLMMFSALTANAHRIHYDAPYARETEGYPSLLVHGPLMAMALAEVLRREQPDRLVGSLTCRALRPLYLGTTAHLRGSAAGPGDDATLELATGADEVHMTATVSFR